MEHVAVTVEKSENNYSAYIETLPGCITTGKSMEEIRVNMYEAVKAHLKISHERGDRIPSAFNSGYFFSFRFDAGSLLSYYKDIFTNSALERMTGINQRQLQSYASGKCRPLKPQIVKIQNALHRLGEELLDIKL